MISRFIFEIVLGIVCFTAVLLFGNVGFASFGLFGLMPLVSRKQPDERELQLFYKVGNTTMGVFILALVAIHFLQPVTISNFKIGDNWLIISTGVFMIIHGLTGIIIFKTNE